jgi:hypothetical protein
MKKRIGILFYADLPGGRPDPVAHATVDKSRHFPPSMEALVP